MAAQEKKPAADALLKKRIRQIIRLLAKAYPDAKCALLFTNPLELLVATILSAQCTDERVNQVTRSLFTKYRSAADYVKVPLAELEQDIRPTGFYRNKARTLQACCQQLVQEHGGQVPKDMEALVRLPGVGRKTANVVLGTAYGIPSGIVVDTHVSRIARRLGLTDKTQPEKIEQDLLAIVPQEEWIDFGHRLIHHGRRICTARKPKCSECPLSEVCPRIGVS
ncbi:MAG: endonuclease III [Thermoguttaceae bacterium]|nr:endonuclease III [Thermoguttaceae bacterium]MDW8038858.1 endonuclease III [Thermoguttaceae bacterium]